MANLNLEFSTYMILLAILIGIVWIIYHLAYRQSHQAIVLPKEHDLPSPKNQKKYASSSLSEEAKSSYLVKIMAYVEAEQAFKLSDITLGEVSQRLEIPKHHLSQVINEKLECGFIELLNQYRVKEAIRVFMMDHTESRSIMDIGREVGFNSKSTFYAAFKKHTKNSPGQYRKDLFKKKSQYQSPFNNSTMKQSAILLFMLSILFINCSQDDAGMVTNDPSTEINLSDDDHLAIHNARTDNNDAIARHDAAAVADNYLDNFFILTSTNGYFEGKENVQGIYESVFGSRTDVLFVRNPEFLNVNTDWNMAAERGNWIGTWKVDDDAIEVKGWYAAKWHKINDTWKLRSEVYTQIECSGDVVCNNKPALE